MVAAIDFHALGQVIWVSFVGGVSVTVLYSFVIYSSGKAAEARRGGNGGGLYASLAVLAMVVFAVAVVVAVTVMLKKS
jgi:uncharacterized membrane-anchored protein